MSAPPFLLQMAGAPGSGKSALARVIGRCAGAVVIDKDVLKTAALEAGAQEPLVAGLAYETFFALAGHLLGQGWAVILDSPSYFETVPSNGAAIAARQHVPYHFIECVCPDREELSRRLRDRARARSQPEGIEDADLSRETIAPPGAYLRVDTTQPIEHCLALALEYLGVASAST